jgi:hypothetical protein
MPVILTKPEQIETGLPPWQWNRSIRPLPDGTLRVIATCVKGDRVGEWILEP